MQTTVVPVITAGPEFTVTLFVAIHPVGTVYEIVATPAERPVENPVAETIPSTAGEPEPHTPPPEASVYVVVFPIHNPFAPDIGDTALILIVLVVAHVPTA